MKSWYILLFTLASFSLLVIIILSLLTPQIESRLKDNVTAAFIENDLNWVNVLVEGRKIILKGQAPTDWLRIKAKKLASNVSGVAVIDSQITIANPLQPYILTAAYDGKQLSIEGYTLNQQSRLHINNSVIDVYGKNNVTSEWQFREGQPSAWAMVTSGVISTLKILKHGKAVFKNQTIKLSGVAPSAKLKTQIDKQLSPYSNQGYVIQADIKVITPAISCQKKFENLLQREQILFAQGGSTIDLNSYPLLERLKLVMDKCEQFGIIISGHTDSKGEEKTNQSLSLNRANAVSSYLIKQGANTNRISTIGYGELNPIADNEVEEGRAKNRRIEFTIEGI